MNAHLAQVPPARQRVLHASIQHDDCARLLRLGLIRVRLLMGQAGRARQPLWPAFHQMFWPLRGGYLLRDLEGGRSWHIDAADAGCLLPNAGRYAIDSEPGSPRLADGYSHLQLRAQVDPSLVRASGEMLPLPGEGHLAAHALAGLCRLPYRSAAAPSRRAWATAAASAIDSCWRALHIDLGAEQDAQLARLLASIDDAPDQPWSLQLMADRLGCSRTHVGRRFAEAGLESPLRLVTRVRVERAAALLVHEDRLLAEIAGRVGFASPYSLARAFRRRYGCSMGEYRRQVR